MALHCLWCPFCSTKKKQVKLSPRVLFSINTGEKKQIWRFLQFYRVCQKNSFNYIDKGKFRTNVTVSGNVFDTQATANQKINLSEPYSVNLNVLTHCCIAFLLHYSYETWQNTITIYCASDSDFMFLQVSLIYRSHDLSWAIFSKYYVFHKMQWFCKKKLR